MNRLIDLKGQTFGRLLVIERKGSDNRKESLWLCKCSCGNETVVRSSCLRRDYKATKSCGYYNKEQIDSGNKRRTHGARYTRLYNIWSNMKERCNSPTNTSYYRYGGKGIKVCDDWQEFIPFQEWALVNGYQDNLTIDRINNDGDYEPSNCRWIFREENSSRATRKAVKCIETGIVYESATKASIMLGLNKQAVSCSINQKIKAGGYHWEYENNLNKSLTK